MLKRSLSAMMSTMADDSHRLTDTSTTARKTSRKEPFEILKEKIFHNFKSIWISALIKRTRNQLNEKQFDYINRFLSENKAIARIIHQFAEKITSARIPSAEKEKILAWYIKGIKESARIGPQLSLSISRFLNETVTGIIAALDIDEFDPGLLDIDLVMEEKENALTELTDIILDSELASEPTDDREHYTEERLQRRYDSLARLLSLKPGFSVVSAVTIVEGQLIIGANASGTESADHLADVIWRKLDIIRLFLYQTNHPDFNLYELPNAISLCVDSLYATGGTAQNKTILAQALLKLRHATGVSPTSAASPDTFSLEETRAIVGLDTFTILLPKGKIRAGDRTESHIAQYTANATSILKSEPLPVHTSLQSTLVKHFHAEQLIAYYLQHIKTYPLEEETLPKIRIGVSKLCCKTCNDALQRLNRLQTRGTHGVAYEGTVDLFAETVHQPAATAPGTPAREKHPSPTHALSSPFFSPGIKPSLQIDEESSDVLQAGVIGLSGFF